LGGYAGTVLRVDMTRQKIVKQPIDRTRLALYYGGRGSDARLLIDELKVDCDPLGPDNILCLSTGALTGLIGPTTGRINAAAKSPLTDIYGNSNAGTHWGPELKYAGYDSIIITGRSSKPFWLAIEDDTVELRSADHLRGQGVFDTTRTLEEELGGDDVRVAAVGQAAENGVLYGSIIFDYWDAAGRTGMGTVMASKGLKAVAVRGTGGLSVADPEGYLEAARDGWLGVTNDPGFRAMAHQSLGTSICVNWGNHLGWLPTRNFTESSFEGADAISGERFRDTLSTRSAPKPAGRACPSCPNRCKRFGLIEEGPYAGTRGNVEYEGVAAFGSKCGIDDLEAVFHAYGLANDYGFDCVSGGNVIATFMELNQNGLLADDEGLDLSFGNTDAMVEMVHRLVQGKGKLGKLAAMGAHKATLALGGKAPDYTTCVKGIDTIACEPRVSKGFGFTYAISSRGSDHLRAHPVYEMIRMPAELSRELFGDEGASQMTAYEGKVAMVAYHEELGAVTDSLGSCRFMQASYYAQHPIPEMRARARAEAKGQPIRPVNSIKYHELLSAATGLKVSYEDLMTTGKRIVTCERALNTRFGLGRRDDRLPPKFTRPLTSGRHKGLDFPEDKLNEMLDDLYTRRGWDLESGLVRGETLRELRMEELIPTLESEGLLK